LSLPDITAVPPSTKATKMHAKPKAVVILRALGGSGFGPSPRNVRLSDA
jgi:hypothetical protein